MKAAIYARVSTADGRQDTENQLTELRRFAGTSSRSRTCLHSSLSWLRLPLIRKNVSIL